MAPPTPYTIWAKPDVPDDGAYPANRVYIRHVDGLVPQAYIGGTCTFASLPGASSLAVGTPYVISAIDEDSVGEYIDLTTTAFSHHEDIYYLSTSTYYEGWNSPTSGSGTGMVLELPSDIEITAEIFVGICGRITYSIEEVPSITVGICGRISYTITLETTAPLSADVGICGNVTYEILKNELLDLEATAGICGNVTYSITEAIEFSNESDIQVGVCSKIEYCIETVSREAVIDYTHEVTCGQVTFDVTDNTSLLIAGETISRVMIDFGDGNKKEYVSLANAAPTHTYVADGYYTVKVAIETNYVVKTGYNKIYLDCITTDLCSDNLFDVAFYSKPKTIYNFYECDDLTKEQWVVAMQTEVPTLSRSECTIPCPNCGDIHLHPEQCASAPQVCLRLDSVADQAAISTTDTIKYIINVFNDCCDDATNVTITEVFLNGYYITITPDVATADVVVGGSDTTITWSGLVVPANGFIELEWTAVLTAAPASPLVTTTSLVSLDQTVSETLPITDTVSVIVS